MNDRNLRDKLRRAGIKVTSDLTSRQRDTVDLYRSQGKIAYYRNERLHFADRLDSFPRSHHESYSQAFCAVTATTSGATSGLNSHGTDKKNPGASSGHATAHPGEMPATEETPHREGTVTWPVKAVSIVRLATMFREAEAQARPDRREMDHVTKAATSPASSTTSASTPLT